MVGPLDSAGAAMALARRRREKQVVTGHLPPVRLLQVLAGVLGVGVVRSMDVDRRAPVVRGPDDVDTSETGARRESARSGEKVDRS
jgi:hypothetical protein